MKITIAAILAIISGIPCINGQLKPNPIERSSIGIKIEEVGSVIPGNLGSPVVIGNELWIFDQNTGDIFRDFLLDGTQPEAVAIEEPTVNFHSADKILNIAPGPDANKVYVVHTQTEEPTSIEILRMPNDDTLYNVFTKLYQTLYLYTISDTGFGKSLIDPVPVIALEAQDKCHVGGGITKLPDGRILWSTGDSIRFGLDGRTAPQLSDNHLGKILMLTVSTTTNSSGQVTSVTVQNKKVAMGLRNPQHLELVAGTSGSSLELALCDIGAATAEEINFVKVSDLMDDTIVENFGWGARTFETNPEDRLSREGTFYIGEGTFQDNSGPVAVGEQPIPELNFMQPHAQYGREEARFAAVTGPVTSVLSFSTVLTAVFSDLPTGKLFGTLDSSLDVNVVVYGINLFDSIGNPTNLTTLAGGRPDPRFFRFPDEYAGVLLEGNGKYYKLTCLTCSELPSSGPTSSPLPSLRPTSGPTSSPSQPPTSGPTSSSSQPPTRAPTVCGKKGDTCESNNDCCSNKCKGRKRKNCK